MTKDQWEKIMSQLASDTTDGEAVFRWEIIKVLWEIRDAIKGGLSD